MKCPCTSWIQTLALAVLAALAWTAGADTLNNPCTPDGPRPSPCWEWSEKECAWVYCPDALPGEKCCENEYMCWIVEENESCCPLCGGSCTWGGGKGTAQGSGTGASGTRAAGGGAQGVVDFQIKLGTLPGEDAFAAIARVRTELPATNWAGAAGLQVLRHGRAEIEVVRGSNGVERIYAPEMDAGVVADVGGQAFELHCWPKGHKRGLARMLIS